MLQIKKALTVATAILAACLAPAQRVELTPVPSGVFKQLAMYVSNQMTLTDQKPPNLTAEPAGLRFPMYGVLKVQGRSFIVVADRPDNDDQAIYVDTNGDGDLTNDAPPHLEKSTYKVPGSDSTLHMLSGLAQINLQLAGKEVLASVGFNLFDRNDSARAAIKNKLMYFADYGVSGQAAFGGKPCKVLLVDEAVSGDFTGSVPTARGGPGVLLFLDRKGGDSPKRFEPYDFAKPFNIGGTNYKLSCDPDGHFLTVGLSATHVAEVARPLGAGDDAIPFAASTTSGQPLNFPGSYKGKVVLLDFWATWCGPCMREVPNIATAYKKYHGQGFEVLGVSFDKADTVAKMPQVIKDKQMAWPQICDRKSVDGAIAKLYKIEAIPQAYLVDGDTGKIIAEGDSIRGEALGKAIEAALSKKRSEQQK